MVNKSEEASEQLRGLQEQRVKEQKASKALADQISSLEAEEASLAKRIETAMAEVSKHL